ncbi:hypothetical protein [Vibrio sp. Vb339]|uniref:hypothetical protein n=1 Tax=Vibrio sp. Vb339 TaxID=1192013 RepID=UPI001554C35F|nr:hypothetical protein [Vibrio sp. Vb339]
MRHQIHTNLEQDGNSYGLSEKVVIDGCESYDVAIEAMNVQLWLTGFFTLFIEILDINE